MNTREIRKLARRYGWRCYHTHDSRRGDEPFPDLLLVKGERLVFVGLQCEPGRPTSEQSGWLKALVVVTQVEAYVWRPHDNAHIQRVLKECK